MKIRILATILSVAMLICILSISAMAAKAITNGTCGENLTWTLDNNNVLTISGHGEMYDYDRDNTSPWYEHSIDFVVINDGVTKIGNYSFLNCGSVTEISIPASVSVIGDYAFEGCKALQRFVVDEDNNSYCSDETGLLYSEDMQLLKCVPYAIDEMTLQEAVLEIAYDAFSDGDCGNIIMCTGDAITYYGTTMFNNYIYIPEDNQTWTEAIKGAFGSNMWFTYTPAVSAVRASGPFGENLTWELTEDGTLTISGEGEVPYDVCPWEEYTSDIRYVVYEEGITSIEGGTQLDFGENLISISVPASVTYLDWDDGLGLMAFYGLPSLERIIVADDNPNYCSDENGNLYSKDKSVLYKHLSGVDDCYVIPEYVTTIFDDAFVYENLVEVRVHENIEAIGMYAFSSCSNLARFVVDENNEYYCSDENGILFSKDMTLLEYVPGKAADTIVIPGSVKDIAYNAFNAIKYDVNIVFEGDAIEYYGGLYGNTIYYPANNPTWTEEIMDGYGDNTWIAYNLRGDVDGSGQITNADLVMVARYIVGVESDNDDAIEVNGDVDGDGEVNNSDLVRIARIIVGI